MKIFFHGARIANLSGMRAARPGIQNAGAGH
jgi:hypothetical protein